MLTKTVGEERCLCICGSGLWCICINFDSEAFPVKFLIHFSISLEFLIHFSWKVKAVQATSEGFSPKSCLQWQSPMTLGLSHKSKDFCSGLCTRALRLPQGGRELHGRRMSGEGVGYLTFLRSKFVKNGIAKRHHYRSWIQSNGGFWN